jgi:hypothetical protein
MCKGCKISESKDDQDKTRERESNPKSMHVMTKANTTYVCTAYWRNSSPGSPEKAYPRQIPHNCMHTTPGEPDANCCCYGVRFCPAFVPRTGVPGFCLDSPTTGHGLPDFNGRRRRHGCLYFGRCTIWRTTCTMQFLDRRASVLRE